MRHRIAYDAARAVCAGLFLAAASASAQVGGGDIETSGPLVMVEEAVTPAGAAGTVTGNVVVPDGTSPEAEAIRAALSREIARMKAEIVTLDRLIERQARLMRTARVDPAEALRQRLPMSECLASFLTPLCADLTGLFAPDGETDGAEGTGAAGATDIEKEPR